MGLEHLMDTGIGSPTGMDAESALARLRETRQPAAMMKTEAVAAADGITWNIEYLDEVITRFARRRDHLLAAAEANPGESRQAVKLAGTADRMRQGLERARGGMVHSLEENRARADRAEEALGRIDSAIELLADALKSLRLVRLEQEGDARIQALEQAAAERFPMFGVSMPLAAADNVDIDFHVREVTRLAYEAEALADLQRESL